MYKPHQSWQSDFPIPPRNIEGLLPPRDLRYGGDNIGGLFDAPVSRLEDAPVGRRNDYNIGQRDFGRSACIDSPRPTMKQVQSRLGNLTFHSRNGSNDLPSLLSASIAPPSLMMSDFGLNSNRNQGNHRKSGGRGGNRNNQNNQKKNNNKQNNNKQNDTKPNNNKPNNDSSDVQMHDIEKQAMEADVSQEFFDGVQPLSLMQLATDVALEFARKGIYERRGAASTILDPSFVAGNNACTICRLNHDSRMQVLSHYETESHKEVEDLFKLKKEQARLIMQKKITKPTHPEPVSRPNADMVAIVRAEVEMNLKPKEMELDPYILGVYESVMKPYWPSPKTTYYCRICNYMEFRTEADHDEHNSSSDHKKREKTYDEAFCLYCQMHCTDAKGKMAHNETANHIKVRDLMDKSKQYAIEHWHKVNEIELPEKCKKKTHRERKVSTNNNVGMKRRAPDPDQNNLKSPTKKFSKEQSFPKNQHINGRKSDSNSDTQSLTRNESAGSPPKSFAEKRTESVLSIPKPSHNVSKTNIEKLKSPTSKDSNPLAPKEKVWFVPVTGYMCAACHVFVEEKNQRAHLREISHTTSVIRFKRQMNS